MKLLFVARHFAYFRNYDSALRELAARGHTIHLAVERDEHLGGQRAVEALAAECPGITYGKVPPRRVDTWSGVTQRIRIGLDYLRFLEPFYDTAPLRRVRARNRTPRLLSALADPPLLRGARWRRWVTRALHVVDQAAPPPPSILEFVRAQQPDALLVTPLVDLGSQQIDYIRAARHLGIPTAVAVWSWDYLSSKAYIREAPERVFVWNGWQEREAVDVHGIPADRVVVTGAQCFDRWFGRQPSRDREALCRQLGLPPERPIVLYVCSGLVSESPPELPFIFEWLRSLRASADPMVAAAGVLVRPYPSRAGEWRDVELTSLGPVAVWGGNPVDRRTRDDYFDSLYHSAAVVGVNTSAFIEAGIVGREVLTILDPRFHDTQEGALHFQYLLRVGGGLLRVGRTLDEHVGQLGDALRRVPGAEHPHRAFLESFVRPYGLDTPATPRFVRAVEELATCPVTPSAAEPPRWRRAVLGGLVRVAARVAGESLIRSPRELDPARQARIAAAAAQADEADKQVRAR